MLKSKKKKKQHVKKVGGELNYSYINLIRRFLILGSRITSSVDTDLRTHNCRTV